MKTALNLQRRQSHRVRPSRESAAARAGRPPLLSTTAARSFVARAILRPLKLCGRRAPMRFRTWCVVVMGVLAGVTIVSAQAPRARNVVLVTLDGARWQEIFTGLNESLLRATTAKETDITT